MSKANDLASLISDGLIGTAELDTGAVTLAKLSDNSVDATKLDDTDSYVIAGLDVSGGQIHDVASIYRGASATTQAGIGLGTDGSVSFMNADAEGARFSGEGRLGLGTQSPLGIIDIEDSLTPFIGMSYGGVNADHKVSWDATGLTISADGGATSELSYISMKVFGGEALHINSDGNIGIGTDSPASALDVVGNISQNGAGTSHWANFGGASQAAAKFTRTDGGAWVAVTIETPSTSGNSRLDFSDGVASGRIDYEHADDSMRFNVAGAERVRIISDGKVGIGTDSPAQKFHVKHTGSDVGLFETSGGTYAGLQLRTTSTIGDGGTAGYLYTYTGSQFLGGIKFVKTDSNSGSLVFRQQINGTNTDVAVITDGNVGVGTLNPTEKLEVNGNIKGSFLSEADRPAVNPTLLMDFANSKNIDPRVKVYRSTTAYVYDGTRVKAEENLITHSADFNTNWTTVNYTIYSNTTTAPDGTNTAFRVSPNSAASGTSVAIAPNDHTSGISKGLEAMTWSIYAKMDSTDYPAISLYWNSSGSANARFDLTTGNVAIANGNGTINAVMVNVGDGWYRCIATYYGATSTAATLYVVDNAADGDWALSNGPDGSKGIFLWGPQIEKGKTCTPYVATNGREITKTIPIMRPVSANKPRIEIDPITNQCNGLIVEEPRTNIYTNSMAPFGGSTGSTNSSDATGWRTICPNGKLEGIAVFNDLGVTSGGYSYNSFTDAFNNNTYTISCYVKPHWDTDYVKFGVDGGYGRLYVDFEFSTETVAVDTVNGTWTNSSAGYKAVGNGWYRIWVTATTTRTSGYQELQFFVVDNGYVTVWGLQVEQGAFPTTYIESYGSAHTRGQEQAVFKSSSDFWNESEGTVFVELKQDHILDNSYPRFIQTSNWLFAATEGTGKPYIQSNAYGYPTQSYAGSNAMLNPGTYKTAFSYKDLEGFSVALDGDVTNGNTSGAVLKTSQGEDFQLLEGGTSRHYTGYIKKLAIYDQRLSDEALQLMTEE